jgi:hypothetical protein
MQPNLIYKQRFQKPLFTLTNLILDFLDCKMQRIPESVPADRRIETRMKSINCLNISSGIKIDYRSESEQI